MSDHVWLRMCMGVCGQILARGQHVGFASYAGPHLYTKYWGIITLFSNHQRIQYKGFKLCHKDQISKSNTFKVLPVA